MHAQGARNALGLALLACACAGQQPTSQAPAGPVPTPSSAPSSIEAAAPAAFSAAPSKPAPEELIAQSLEGLETAWNHHDVAKVAGFYASDCVLVGEGEPVHGRDALARSIQILFDVFKDAKVAATRAWIQGHVAVIELVGSGTMGSDFLGRKATQRRAGQFRVHVLFFDDEGFIHEMHDYADSAAVLAQLDGKTTAPPVPTLPTNPPDVHVGKGTSDDLRLADWGKALDGALSKDDSKAILPEITETADDWVNVTGRPATRGKAAVARELAALFKAVPDAKWTPVRAWGIDGFAIVESTVTGTPKQKLGPLEPSTSPISAWPWIDIWQASSDGHVAHHWGYADMGALKPLHIR